MKKLLIAVLAFVVVVFAACGVKTDTPPPIADTEAAGPTTVSDATTVSALKNTTPSGENAAEETTQRTSPAQSTENRGSTVPPVSTKSGAQAPNQEIGTSSPVTYNVMHGDWPEYKNASEVVEKADLVFEGKVTGISFQVLDMRTSLPPARDTEEWNRSLYTIYDVEITTAYKGAQQRTMQVKMDGGLRAYRVDDQLKALGPDASKGIPLMEGMPVLAVGKTYLFAVRKNGDLPAFILNTDQSVYDLANLSAKQSNVAAKDVIARFG